MNDRAHIVEIDRIVLTGVDQRHPGSLIALIEAEVRRALERTGMRTPMGLARNETRVAGEVARTVVRSIQGGFDGV
jgi:hypothetical protein